MHQANSIILMALANYPNTTDEGHLSFQYDLNSRFVFAR